MIIVRKFRSHRFFLHGIEFFSSIKFSIFIHLYIFNLSLVVKYLKNIKVGTLGYVPGALIEINLWWVIVRSWVKMHLVGKVLGQIPTKLQTDPTGNHEVMSLGDNPSTRLLHLGHNISVYGFYIDDSIALYGLNCE